MFNAPYEIPIDCGQLESGEICEFQVSTYYRYGYLSISLSASSTRPFGGDTYYASIALTKYGDLSYSQSTDHQCKHKDDCARDFSNKFVPMILNQSSIDFEAMKYELLPLLASNLSTETNDMLCFDSNENIRQCAIASKPGVCEVSYELSRRTKPTRSCNRELIEIFGTEPRITMFDFGGRFASLDIKCNRSLCNGPLTSQSVKEILFKYNITKTIEGRLNNGLNLSLSLLIFIFNIILLFFI